MRQEPWRCFGDAFHVPKDTNPWPDLRYDRIEGTWRPVRTRFHADRRRGPPLVPRGPEVRSLVRRHGIYLIAQHGRILYVGHALGGETFLTRLRKHRLKLTGSDGGSGIGHPLRWQAFARARYADGRLLPEDDTLAGFAFSLFAMPDPALDEIKVAEGLVYRGCLRCGPPPPLNDPTAIREGEGHVAVVPPPP